MIKERAPLRWLQPLVVALAFVWSAWQLFDLVNRHAVDCLYHDQWDFLAPVFDGRGPWAVFAHQHGPHRQGLGMLLTARLYDATAWSNRAEGFFMAGTLALASLVAVAVARRLRGQLRISDAALVVLFLSTAQYETMLIVPNSSHSILPMLLIVAAAAALLIRRTYIRLAALVPLHFLCTFTGFAVFGGAALTLAFAAHLSWSLRARAWGKASASAAALGCAVATYALFFHQYVWNPAVPRWRFPAAPLAHYPGFVAVLLANPFRWPTLSQTTSIAISTPLAALVLATAAATWWKALTAHRDSEVGRWCAVGVPALASLGFAVNAAVGRMPLGIDGALAGRYHSWAFLGVGAVLLACAAWGPSSRTSRVTELYVVLSVVACLLAAPGWAERQAARYAESKRIWTQTYLTTGSVQAAQKAPGVFFPAYPKPGRTDLEGKLTFLRERRLNLFRAPWSPVAPASAPRQ